MDFDFARNVIRLGHGYKMLLVGWKGGFFECERWCIRTSIARERYKQYQLKDNNYNYSYVTTKINVLE